jgi:hypothetical protein
LVRGRLASECGYSQEYIDAMVFPDVLKMSEYWAAEPPVSYMYRKVHFKENEVKKGTNLIPQTQPARSFNKLPEYLQKALVSDWLRLHPGKTEADFHKQREAQVKKQYAGRLAEARKKKLEEPK